MSHGTAQNHQVGTALADVGCCDFTVAATENEVHTTALDGIHHTDSCRSVATREHPANSVRATVDVDHGLALRVRTALRRVVGFVTAAEHLVDGVLGIAFIV